MGGASDAARWLQAPTCPFAPGGCRPLTLGAVGNDGDYPSWDHHRLKQQQDCRWERACFPPPLHRLI